MGKSVCWSSIIELCCTLRQGESSNREVLKFCSKNVIPVVIPTITHCCLDTIYTLKAINSLCFWRSKVSCYLTIDLLCEMFCQLFVWRGRCGICYFNGYRIQIFHCGMNSIWRTTAQFVSTIGCKGMESFIENILQWWKSTTLSCWVQIFPRRG